MCWGMPAAFICKARGVTLAVVQKGYKDDGDGDGSLSQRQQQQGLAAATCRPPRSGTAQSPPPPVLPGKAPAGAPIGVATAVVLARSSSL
jgi:hypothetical protein